jgi:hypothetical protein
MVYNRETYDYTWYFPYKKTYKKRCRKNNSYTKNEKHGKGGCEIPYFVI